jgi:3-hydroxybutyrate dehydrogenase
MEKPLRGKIALVTGSTSGLGKEIAEALAQAGCHIALNGFGDSAEIQAFREKLEKAHGIRAFYHHANLTVPAEIRGLMAAIEAEQGSIDILVNNAGMQFVSALEDFPEEKWDMIIALNLSAAFHTTKAALPGMKKRKWGRIINISSAHGLVASAFKSAYVTSKHGLNGLTKVIALECARDGITCNALCPGYIHTHIVEGQIEDQARVAGISRERVIEEIILAKHVTKEFIETKQVAAFVLLLCSDAGASTTGTAIPIDGGWTAT